MHYAGEEKPADLKRLEERTQRALAQEYNYAPMPNRMWRHLMTLGDADRAWEAMLEESGPPEPKTWRPPLPPSCRPREEEPAVEEPAVEEPAVEEPAVEEPPVEEPAVEEPAAEEPPVEEPAPAPCPFRMGTLKGKPKSSKKKGKKR